jgi:hypothetical protein
MTAPVNDMSLLDAVNYYESIGMCPHPLSRPDDHGNSPGKRPLLDDWSNYKPLSDRDKVKHFKNNRCNIGNVCGQVSDVTGVDRDFICKGIWDSILDGIDTSDFVMQSRTPGRDHIYFKYVRDLGSAKHHALGFEILNDGTNAALTPSVHISGSKYQFNRDPVERPSMPPVMVERIKEVVKIWHSLEAKVNKCRPSFQKFFKAHFTDNQKSNPHFRDMSVFHGASGRELTLHLFAELLRNGATKQELMLLCMLIFMDDYDADTSSYQIDHVNPNATATAESIEAHPILSQFYVKGRRDYNTTVEVEPPQEQPIDVNYQTEEIQPIDIEYLKKYLGDDNFIIGGMNYLCTNTDGYPEYALQNMICALSTVVKRRLMLRLTIGKVYPNIWNINFGISTLSRKTTMQMLVLEIMRGANLDVFLPQDFTPEALISEMAVRTVSEKNTKSGPERVERINGDGRLNSKKAMWRDEYSSFVGAMGKSYNQSLKETLCHFYDCPGEYDRALRREHFYLEQIYFVINANTTIPAFSKVIDPFIDFMSGWLIRHTMVNPTYEKPSKRIQIMPPEQIALRNRLSDFMRCLDHALGNNIIDVEADPLALEYWNDWVERRTDEIRKTQDEVEAAVFGRYNIIALKLAMLFELGKEFKNVDDSLSKINKINTLNSLTISLDSIHCAIYLIDNIYLRYFREVKELIELNNLKDLIQVTLHALKKHRTLPRSKLLRETKLTSRELDEAIKTLEERGQLYIFVDAPNDTRKKPVIMYQYIPTPDTTVSSYAAPVEPVEASL